MKKLIIPFDDSNASKGPYSYAKYLNNIEPILLSGIFLSPVDFSRFFLAAPALQGDLVLLEKSSGEENIRENINEFTSICKKNNIKYRIHEDTYDFALPELIKESRFADLMIIGSEIFLKDISDHHYNIFLKDTLQHTECPVLVVPEKFYLPSLNLLTYDGSTSSVFAIKQFAYLFPHLCDNKTILVYTAEETEDIPAVVNIEELASIHFNNLAITVLTALQKENLTDWVLKHENPIMISGSFSRPGYSSMFAKRFAVNIISAHKIPVFIAHR